MDSHFDRVETNDSPTKFSFNYLLIYWFNFQSHMVNCRVRWLMSIKHRVRPAKTETITEEEPDEMFVERIRIENLKLRYRLLLIKNFL